MILQVILRFRGQGLNPPSFNTVLVEETEEVLWNENPRTSCVIHEKQFYCSMGPALARQGVIREGERFTMESGVIGIA
jgi:hypothetical protein